MRPTRPVVATLVLAVTALADVVHAGAAGADPAAVGVYATWTPEGEMQVPVPGFPVANYASDGGETRLVSGSGAFLGPETPFGAVFGSSQDATYLDHSGAATLAFTFAAPTPAGDWGFALGDVDADHVTIEAIGVEGPLSPTDLGFQGTFNQCEATPRPVGCTRPPFTDVPHWDEVTSQLHGNVADTDGAAGWFRPATSVASLTVTFVPAADVGVPSTQVWFAGLVPDGATTTSTTFFPPSTTAIADPVMPGAPPPDVPPAPVVVDDPVVEAPPPDVVASPPPGAAPTSPGPVFPAPGRPRPMPSGSGSGSPMADVDFDTETAAPEIPYESVTVEPAPSRPGDVSSPVVPRTAESRLAASTAADGPVVLVVGVVLVAVGLALRFLTREPAAGSTQLKLFG